MAVEDRLGGTGVLVQREMESTPIVVIPLSGKITGVSDGLS